MENQTEQIRETSERIKGIMTSFGKQLKEISKKRKEQQKNNQLRLKRKNKITSLSSNISKSVNKIGGAIIRGGGNIFDKILTFASLILFGVLINNIGKIKKSIDEFIKKINKLLDPVKNFIIMLGNAAQRFVSIGKQKTQLNDDNLTVHIKTKKDVEDIEKCKVYIKKYIDYLKNEFEDYYDQGLLYYELALGYALGCRFLPGGYKKNLKKVVRYHDDAYENGFETETYDQSLDDACFEISYLFQDETKISKQIFVITI